MERAIKVTVTLTDNKREWDDRKAECEVKGNPWLETDEDNWERKKKHYEKIGQKRQKTNSCWNPLKNCYAPTFQKL